MLALLLAVLAIGATAPPAGAAADADGNPLPPGVVRRIGSSRLRHAGFLNDMAYTPDGKWLASTSSDGSVHLWDVQTGRFRWRIRLRPDAYEQALAVSPDGASIAVLSEVEYVLLATANGAVLARHTWPVDRGDNGVRTVAISGDMKTLARGCWDATVRLYDAGTGQETVRFTVGEKAKHQIPRSIRFDARGKIVYVTAYDKSGVGVYDASAGKLLRRLKTEPEASCRLALSSDGRLMAGMGHRLDNRVSEQVHFWDLSGAKRLGSVETPFLYPIGGAFSPDGRLFAAGGQGREIVVFDALAVRERVRLPWHPSTICLTFSPDGRRLAAGDNGGCIAFWDTRTWKRVAPTPEPSSDLFDLHFTGNGQELRALSSDGIYWWRVADGQRLRLFPRAANTSWWLWPSPDETLVASRLQGGELELLETATGRVVQKLVAHKKAVYHAAFSPDGRRLYSVAGFDPRVIVWDVRTGKILHQLKSHNRFANRVAVSPDGRWLASWASDAAAAPDYDIRLWDAANATLVHRLTPRWGSAFQIVFSADSRRLVSVGGEPGRPNPQGEIQLWDVPSGKEIRALIGHKERVACVAITADARMIATGAGDKTLRLWEAATGLERRRLIGHEGYVESLDFSPDGRLLAAASSDAPAFLWESYGLEGSPGAKRSSLSPAALWQRLGDTEAAAGFDALCILTHRPDAVTILRDGWKSRPRATAEQMRGWIHDLDSKQFKTREKAGVELERLVVGHEEMLRKAAEQSGSPEVRRHLERLLAHMNPERLRRARMVEVLEQVRSDAARSFLGELAVQSEDVVLAREAGESVQRLARR